MFNRLVIACLTLILVNSYSLRASSDEWKIQIVLTDGEYHDNATWLGVSKNASADLDNSEFRKPVLNIPVPQVYFYRPEWDSLYSAFATDIRPIFEQSETWDFQIKSPIGRTVSLEFYGIDDVNPLHQIYLINEEQRNTIDLRQHPKTTIDISQHIMKFKLIVGILPDIMKINPEQHHQLKVGKNYPNPFNAETQIPVSLPQNNQIDVHIFNLTGQLVRSIYSGFLPAGNYTFKWNGLNDAGHDLPSGLYFYRMRIGDTFNISDTMLLLR